MSPIGVRRCGPRRGVRAAMANAVEAMAEMAMGSLNDRGREVLQIALTSYRAEACDDKGFTKMLLRKRATLHSKEVFPTILGGLARVLEAAED